MEFRILQSVERTLRPIRICLTVLAAGLCWPTGPVAAGVHGSAYAAKGRCGPFARVSAPTPGWACVGIVAGPAQGLKMPRAILALADGTLLITDMAGWTATGKGRVLRLAVGKGGRPRISTLLSGLDLPHGIAMGPDGRVYVGEQGRIIRFDPANPKGTRETVLKGLPTTQGYKAKGKKHLHPLTQFVFDREGGLIVNLGAATDRCEQRRGRKVSFPFPCPADSPKTKEAALWRLGFDWPKGTPGAFEPLARGLRNSLALAVHPVSGLILQGENNIDRWAAKLEEERPPEELNVIEPGLHYGWPYCTGPNKALPSYRGRVRCAGYAQPEALMPAHAAPFSMAYYRGPMFPELKGKLVVAMHGWKRNGQRLAAYRTDADGRPKAPAARPGGWPGYPMLIIGRWHAIKGVRPKGRPGGLAIARDGAIWFVDYETKTVMVVLRRR
ncbi:MAG: PQQ-dependent sugar dehydrogenase [Methyloligellaceae bacterium]